MSGPSIASADFWGRPGLRPLMAALNGVGEEARVVGGAVRNTLLGLAVTDVDIATTATPEEVTRRVRAAGLKAVPTGIAHGTVTVVVAHTGYEVTTLREDMETDGRRAVVRFGRSWSHDAARRDFTINALYAGSDGAVVDLVGGLADLAARRVRFIGDADARIAEDYLRILRLFRFHAAYGEGPLDQVALGAVVRGRAGLRGLSRERVRAELLKLLVARGAAATLAVMSDHGLVQPLLAGIADAPALSRMAALEQELALAPEPIRRLAALAVRVADDGPRLRDYLRLSNGEMRRLTALVEAARRVPEPGDGDAGVRAYIYGVGAQAALDGALFAASQPGQGWGTDGPGLHRHLGRISALAETWPRPRLPIGAADLVGRGVRPGPAMGRALAAAEAAWIATDFSTGADVAERLLGAALAAAGVDAPR